MVKKAADRPVKSEDIKVRVPDPSVFLDMAGQVLLLYRKQTQCCGARGSPGAIWLNPGPVPVARLLPVRAHSEATGGDYADAPSRPADVA